MWFGKSFGARKTARHPSLFGNSQRPSRRDRARTLRLEPLEERKLLATLYMNDNWAFVADNDTDGFVSVGDTVTNTGDAAGPVVTATYGVDAYGVVTSGSATGSVAGFETIQDAIDDAAGPGDVVAVLEGTYDENLTIAKSDFTLKGNTGTAADVVIVDSDDSGVGIAVGLSTNVTIQDLQVTGAGDDGIAVDWSDTFTATNVQSDSNASDGLSIGEGAPVVGTITLTDVVADDNLEDGASIRGGGTATVLIGGGSYNNNDSDGIEIEDVGDVATTNVTATGNDPGVWINGAASYADVDGDFSGNNDHGIQLIDIAGNVTLTRTTANDNDADDDGAGDGLNATDGGDLDGLAIGGDLVVLGATFSDTDRDGVASHQERGVYVPDGVGDDVTFENSGAIEVTVDGNDSDGVNIQGADDGFFTNGAYEFNGGDGLRLDSCDDLFFTDVTANSNLDDGLDVNSSDTVTILRGTYNSNDSDGIELFTINVEATLTDVDASLNGSDGFDADLIPLVTIDGGTFNENDFDGMQFDDVAEIGITEGATASDNMDDGLDVDTFTTATLSFLTTDDNATAIEVLHGVTLNVEDWTTVGNTSIGGILDDVDEVNFTTTTGTAETPDQVDIFETQFRHVRAGVEQDFVDYDQIGTLNLFTGDGRDVFVLYANVNNAANAGDVNLDGGEPSAGPSIGPGDRLVMADGGTAMFTNPATGTGVADPPGGAGAIDFTDIEELLAEDDFEFNDTPATATILGSLAKITLRDLTIHDLDDVDYFKYTAQDTGKLIVNMFLDHAVGDLDLSVQDAHGNVLSEGVLSNIIIPGLDMEHLVIPVVSQEEYWIEVVGVAGDTNEYDLEIENFAAPAPDFVDLPPKFFDVETFTLAGTPSPIGDDTTTEFNITVSGIAGPVTDLDVRLNVLHTNDEDLDVTLISPTGTEVELFSDVGGSGDNFIDTILDDEAAVAITAGAAPFTGAFIPENPLSAFDGEDPNGVWTLRVVDDTAGETGTVQWWSLDIAHDLLLNDTGMSQTDDVTLRTDPQIIIEADLHEFALEGIRITGPDDLDFGSIPGAAVEVFVNGKSVGFAKPINSTGNTLFRFTFAPGQLPAAVFPADSGGWLHYVKAAVRIFDGQKDDGGIAAPATARTQLSEPLVLTIDAVLPPVSPPNLLDSSDSGSENDDDVTSVATPAFDGTGEMNAEVRIFVQDVGDPAVAGDEGPVELVGRGLIGSDSTAGVPNDQIGTWEVTVEPLDDAIYDVFAEVEDAAGNITRSEPLRIEIDTLAPNTPYLDLVEASDTGRHDDDDEINTTTPTFTMTTGDTTEPAPFHLLDDNFKFRIFDRDETTPIETLIFNSHPPFVGVNTHVITSTVGDAGWLIAALADSGVFTKNTHNLKLEVEDRAGNISHDFLLRLVVDTKEPPVFFGIETHLTDGLHPESDTGVEGLPDTFSDRITSDTTPTFFGAAEANAVIRLYVDVNDDGAVDAGDVFLGSTVAVPLDGSNQFPEGYWELTSSVDMNDPAAVPAPLLHDGLRTILVTAEDPGGEVSDAEALDIFIDTEGPRVTDLYITGHSGFDLLDPKPSDGPTPLVLSLSIDIEDLPERVAAFLYHALAPGVFPGDPATEPGHFRLEGDHNGVIPIQSIDFNPDVLAAGQPATGTIVLEFAEPLPDDRFTLTISDDVVDPAGNRLDGESNAVEPHDPPQFPSGDGQPGGDFVARFTVDSRAELGVWTAGSVYLDLNGNFRFDPDNADLSNRDVVHTLGFTTDQVFAGNFAENPGDTADGFDKLAVYGRTSAGSRWLIDTTNDGVPDLDVTDPAGVTGMPVAGNFDNSGGANGDEVGLFTGTTWWFDINHNFQVNFSLASSLRGYPMVGDFDGDGYDDLATLNSQLNRIEFDLTNGTFRGWSGTINATITLPFGEFIGVRERPVAADMDGDGIDDVGLWVPDRGAITPEEAGEWYFLISNDVAGTVRSPGTIDTLNHRFTPAPFGHDLFAQFGHEFAIPVIGNFDPPVAATAQDPIDTTPDDPTQEDPPQDDAPTDPQPAQGDSSQDDAPAEPQPTQDDSSQDDAPAEPQPAQDDPAPGSLNLLGTPGDDVLRITPGSMPNSWIANLNGTRHDVDGSFVSITFDGGGGDDRAVLRDDPDGEDTFTASPDEATLAGEAYSIHLTSVRRVRASSSPGNNDLAVLHDAPGSRDTLKASAKKAKLVGDTFVIRANGFRDVRARATEGDRDVAKLCDSALDDTLEAGADWARVSNDDAQLGFSIEASGFGLVKTRSTNDGDTTDVDPDALDWLFAQGWL